LRRTCLLLTQSGHSAGYFKVLFERRELYGQASVQPANSGRLNKNVSAVLNLIERAHAFDKRSGWHPNPVCTSRINV
jgi:hypothetical protein